MEVVPAQSHALGVVLCDSAQHVHVDHADFIARLGVRTLCPAVSLEAALWDSLYALYVFSFASAAPLWADDEPGNAPPLLR